MDKGQGHGVELVCDIADNDIVMTNNTVIYVDDRSRSVARNSFSSTAATRWLDTAGRKIKISSKHRPVGGTDYFQLVAPTDLYYLKPVAFAYFHYYIHTYIPMWRVSSCAPVRFHFFFLFWSGDVLLLAADDERDRARGESRVGVPRHAVGQV